MAKDAETLTSLVADRVGEGRELTYRKFEERAIDPVSGYRPSRTVLWKVGNGQRVQIEPRLIRAIHAGLGLPLARVQAAAAFQYLGLSATAVAGGLVLHDEAVEADTEAVRGEVLRQRRAAENSRDS
jgi:hypothetical protein